MGTGSEGQNNGDGVGMGKEFVRSGGDVDENNGDGWDGEWGPTLVPMQLSSSVVESSKVSEQQQRNDEQQCPS